MAYLFQHVQDSTSLLADISVTFTFRFPFIKFPRISLKFACISVKTRLVNDVLA